MSAQNISLAMNYVKQGEYEKARIIYEQLHQKNPRKQDYLLGLSDVYIQQNKFEKAQNLLKKYLKNNAINPKIQVELGYTYQIQKDTIQANVWYDKAIQSVENKIAYAYSTGRAFEKRNLLDYAIQTYEIANAQKPQINYSILLAKLYGEKGDEKLMFSNYIDLMEKNKSYIENILRNLSEFLENNPKNQSNVILKKLLIQKLQKEPKLLYNQLLSWVFIQEEAFENAFKQEKAIFKRSMEKDYSRLFNLADICVEQQNYNIVFEIFEFIKKESLTEETKLSAIEKEMQIKVSTTKDYKSTYHDFEAYFADYGFSIRTLNLQILYASFLAFQQKNKQKALSVLESTLGYNFSATQQADVQMLMADILVSQEQYNQALVKYSLVVNLIKNTPKAQIAKYKTAITSYYKGDYDWALTQLNVLKKGTTQNIANNALEMSMFLKQGKTDIDSTQISLNTIAKADFLVYQNQHKKALEVLNVLVEDGNNTHLKDHALYKKAKILEHLELHPEAITTYTQLIEGFPNSILVDNALFKLAKIQLHIFDNLKAASDSLEKLIFEHQDSIFFVEARKLYRGIRDNKWIE